MNVVGTSPRRRKLSTRLWRTDSVCTRSKPKWRILRSSFSITTPINILRTPSTPKKQSARITSRALLPLLSRNSRRRDFPLPSKVVPNPFTRSTTKCRRNAVMWIVSTTFSLSVLSSTRLSSVRNPIAGRFIRSLRTSSRLTPSVCAIGSLSRRRTDTNHSILRCSDLTNDGWKCRSVRDEWTKWQSREWRLTGPTKVSKDLSSSVRETSMSSRRLATSDACPREQQYLILPILSIAKSARIVSAVLFATKMSPSGRNWRMVIRSLS